MSHASGAAAVQVISTDPQPGVAGQRLPEMVRVRVVDAQGKGVPGVNVAYQVTAGGEVFSSGAENTDALGYAQVWWTLGARACSPPPCRRGGWTRCR